MLTFFMYKDVVAEQIPEVNRKIKGDSREIIYLSAFRDIFQREPFFSWLMLCIHWP
jgi:hypothetical protein